MIIIKSFEKAPIDNLISVLASKPDRVIFLGESVKMETSMQVYERVLREQNIYTKLTTREIQVNNLPNIIETVTTVLEEEKAEDCILDVTGGEELPLLAFGMVYERTKHHKNVKLQRFNIYTGKMIDCDGDNEVAYEGTYKLDVKGLISLYGGVVLPEDPQPSIEETVEVVDAIWELARTDSTKWNKTISYMKELEKKGDISEEPYNVELVLREVKDSITDYSQKYHEVKKLLQELEQARLIADLHIERDYFTYQYKNGFVKRCLTKAGDALEMKAYYEALTFTEKEKPYFNDCFVSVNIDWDGIIHPLDENWKDTTNEIDLMLMKGLIPIFISCKNGKIGEEEIYKLNTVATRFGGKYAKKVLIATKLEKESEFARQAYMQRAKDMGVILIPYAGKLSKQEWKNMFKKIIES